MVNPNKASKDAHVIQFLTECYANEAAARILWIEKNKNKVLECAKFKKEPKNNFDTDITAYIMQASMPTVKRDHISSAYNRFQARPNDGEIKGIESIRHGHSIVDVGLGDPKNDPRLDHKDDANSDPLMRPVDPDHKRLLHQEEPGREDYLKKRYKIMPGKRYYFTECNSWNYGWRLKDYKTSHGPKYPNYADLMRTLKTKVGPAPDPPHYKSSIPTFFCN